MPLIWIGITLALASGLQADTLTLRTGRQIQGTYLGGSAPEVKIDVGKCRKAQLWGRLPAAARVRRLGPPTFGPRIGRLQMRRAPIRKTLRLAWRSD